VAEIPNPFDPTAVPDLLPWFEPFAHALVPEWSSMPVYVVDTNLSGCHGVAGDDLDETFRNKIKDWRGRGACLALDVRGMQKWVKAIRRFASAPAREHHYRTLAVATFIHELAHLLEQPTPYVERAVSEPPRTKQRKLTNFLGHIASMPYSLDESPATLVQHEARFIRIAAHLVYRANQSGVEVLLGDVAAGQSYGLSSGAEYMTTLRAEAEAMAGETFATIKATQPPRDFVALWRTDVLAWGARIANPSDLQLAAATAALSIFPKE
jgi:hypothetical protein